MTRAELVPKVAALRAEGLFYREIGERLGISKSYATALWHDPDGSQDRARKASYGGVCVDCGARTDGSNGRAKAPERCVPCTAAHKTVWTDAAIVAAIRRFHRRYGRPPVAEDWNPQQAEARGQGEWARRFYDDGDYPVLNTVQRVFGSWAAGIEAAGYRPLPSGVKLRDFTPDDVAEMIRLYREGLSSTQVAARFGCVSSAVLRHLHREGVQIRPRPAGRVAA